jgi:hypothetical protein
VEHRGREVNCIKVRAIHPAREPSNTHSAFRRKLPDSVYKTGQVLNLRDIETANARQFKCKAIKKEVFFKADRRAGNFRIFKEGSPLHLVPKGCRKVDIQDWQTVEVEFRHGATA